MNQIRVGHYEQDGEDVYLPLGFVPDYIRLVDFHTDTNIIVYEWWERMQDDQATGKQEGISYTEGVTANLADDAGIQAYDTGSQAPTIGEWTASTAYTARSATANGSFVKGTTSGTNNLGQDVDREAIFECVTAGTSGTTEPTWPTAPGENTASDNGVVWQLVTEPTFRGGYQGVLIADNIQTDGQEMYYLAIKADDSRDHGDVSGWSGGVDLDWK